MQRQKKVVTTVETPAGVFSVLLERIKTPFDGESLLQYICLMYFNLVRSLRRTGERKSECAGHVQVMCSVSKVRGMSILGE
jgi:hypothetical protein